MYLERSMLRLVHLICFLPLFALMACGDPIAPFNLPDPETAVDYTVTLNGAPEDGFEGDAEDVLNTFRQIDDGAQSFAFLRRRAESDIALITKMLNARGYYLPEVTATVTQREDNPAMVDVVFNIDAGEAFILQEHLFEMTGGEAPALIAGELGSPVSATAIAESILSAEDAAIARLKRQGYAYARFLGRSAVANPAARTLSVTSRVYVGKKFKFGETQFEGVTVVPYEYLESYIEYETGADFNASQIKDYQSDLSTTQLFNAVSVEIPEDEPQTDSLPVLVRVEERLPRTSKVGLRLSSDLGPTIATSLTHRNLLGRNETGTVGLELSREAQTLTLEGEKPQFLRDGQTLTGDIVFENASQASYSGPSLSFAAGLRREFGRTLTGEIQTEIEWSEITDSGVTNNASLLGFPVNIYWDTRRDLLDPKSGVKLDLLAAPYIGRFDGGETQFVKSDLKASSYFALDEGRDTIIAGRFRVANVFANGIGDVPAPHRVYVGGGGSVRGYANDAIGPIDPGGDPSGGLSGVEAGIELRRRFVNDWGAVVFYEGGAVSENQFSAIVDHFSTAFGFGVRYHSIIGPVRADLAFPLDNSVEADTFKIYLAIGQAF